METYAPERTESTKLRESAETVERYGRRGATAMAAAGGDKLRKEPAAAGSEDRRQN